MCGGFGAGYILCEPPQPRMNSLNSQKYEYAERVGFVDVPKEKWI
jgi:hypothetical protein